METNEKLKVLSEYFGHHSFRQGQEEIIDSILSGRDCLGVMPTGAGKSLCYQVPALMSEGITVVVSPLISLMKDQVSSLIQSGVRAAYLNSSLTSEQFNTALANAKRGMYKIIYVAPERLCTPAFLSLANSVMISQVTVDEAHCVSQWGQDFRPSYTKIPEFLSQLSYRPVVSAFTATATKQVKEDIVKLLTLKNPFTITTGFDRKNLYFGVIHPKNKYEQAKEIVLENKDKCGIIYCSTRKNVEMVCEKLCEDGIVASRYHAGLSDEERKQNQEDFIFDRVNVMVATNAFGMGIDKSNVSYVIHYNMPKNIESYYQEAGRAGRDGEEAKCILLYSGQDVRTNKFLIENSKENSDLDEQTREILLRRDLSRLKSMTDYCNTTGCLREFILNYFGEKAENNCSKCSNCEKSFQQEDITVNAQKILSCIYRLYQRKLRFGETAVAEILAGADNERIKKFNLKTLSTYGIMKDCTQVKIRNIISFLKQKNYIAEGDYNTLVLTQSSQEVLSGKVKLVMNVPKAERIKKPAGQKANSGGIVAFNTDLFERLKKLRREIADGENVPAYIIFSDATLRDMCIKMPSTTPEFLEVSGVGKKKSESYGLTFINEIRNFLKENPGVSQPDTIGENISLIEYVKSESEKLHSVDEEFSLVGLCDEIISQLGVDGDRGILRDSLKQWLINENYLTEEISGGTKQLRTTILSEEAGIVEREKLGSKGKSYISVLFGKNAQEFIFSNLGEIKEA